MKDVIVYRDRGGDLWIKAPDADRPFALDRRDRNSLDLIHSIYPDLSHLAEVWRSGPEVQS